MCDCGNKISVLGNGMKRGDTSSCGCWRSEKISSLVMIDLTGKTFGRLTVLKRADNYTRKDGTNFIQWECECSCGNIVIKKAVNIHAGHTLSCGCLNRDKLLDRNEKNSKKLEKYLVGKKLGRLRVIKKDGYVLRKNNKKSYTYLCKCDCGEFRSVVGTQLKVGVATSCGCKKESALATYLKSYFYKKFDAELEYSKFKSPKTKKSLYFDIYLPKEKVFIEIHGKQHYEFNGYFYKSKEEYEEFKYRDEIKKEYAEKNGIYIEIDTRKYTNKKKALDYILKRINDAK